MGSLRLQQGIMFWELKPSPSEVIDLSDVEPSPKLSFPEFEAKCNTLVMTGATPTHAEVLALWDEMPPCLLSANVGERFLCAGSNPRSPVSLSVGFMQGALASVEELYLQPSRPCM